MAATARSASSVDQVSVISAYSFAGVTKSLRRFQDLFACCCSTGAFALCVQAIFGASGARG